MSKLVCLLTNNLYSYKQEVLGFEVDRSVRYKVMAMLLDFEENWENKFQYVVQAWSELVGGSSHVAFGF